MSAPRISGRHSSGTTRPHSTGLHPLELYRASGRAAGRTRNRARALVVAPVLTAAVVGGMALSQPASAATTWEGLRQCESGGNYSTNTGNGYYGAYQFSLPTWRSLGYSGLPSDASPAVQDQAAMELALRSGFGQWPTCGRGMGADDLTPGASSSGTGQASRAADRQGTLAVPVSASNTNGSPHLTTALVNQVREDVRSWQAQLNTHGYSISVDGRYGPESANAARAFQAAHGLEVDGIVGPQTWAATFG